MDNQEKLKQLHAEYKYYAHRKRHNTIFAFIWLGLSGVYAIHDLDAACLFTLGMSATDIYFAQRYAKRVRELQNEINIRSNNKTK